MGLASLKPGFRIDDPEGAKSLGKHVANVPGLICYLSCRSFPSPRRFTLPDTIAAIAITSHDPRGTSRNLEAGVDLGGLRTTSP
jgi:succinate dehydrogenase/fumarate reductase-like Fe-S protein